jgi:hypothetical protein
MGITSQIGLNRFDGILGINPITSDESSSFVRNMKGIGEIDNLMFSLFPYGAGYLS